MKYTIPVKIFDIISKYVDENYKFNDKQRFKLIKKLISLWIYIYNYQQNDCLTDSLNKYSNIHHDKLKIFRLKINNIDFNYSRLINILVDIKLIDINEIYSKANFSKSYRILTDFITFEYIEVEVDIDLIFNDFRDKKYWIVEYPEYKKIINDAYNTKIDLIKYIDWINNNINKKLDPKLNKGFLVDRYLTKDRAFKYINEVIKINMKNLWFKVSDEGRFYSSLTNLNKTALPFLKFYKRNIVEIDAKNCQPLLLSSLIEHDEYKKDVEAGIFYDKCAKKMNKSRNDFKNLSYKYIFFSNSILCSGKIFNTLNELYPGLIEQINKLRLKYKNLARELQRLESEIFVNNISKAYFKMILRHDAVLIFEEDYEIIGRKIIEEFKKLKLDVKLKIKRFKDGLMIEEDFNY